MASFAKVNTKITLKPPLCSHSTFANFKFKCKGVKPCRFQVNLNGTGWSKKLKKGALFLGPLPEGNHSLCVRAIDATGKKDKSPECYNWTIGIDDDGDGYSDYCEEDCNDLVSVINPGVTEIPCNSTDENCNGDTDDDIDSDGDSYSCVSGGDCNDLISPINPGATEIKCNCFG